MSKRLTRTLLSGVAVAAITMAALPSQEAQAQKSAKAEELNDKGKGLFKERRYLEAYRAFKQATELSPEGRFYFNLCFSLNYLERFQEAIDACEQVGPNGADEKLLKKTNAVLGALRAKVPSQPPPDPNPDPNNPDPNNPDPNNPDPNNPDPNNPDPNNPNPNNPDPNNPDPNNPDPNIASTGPATVPGFDPFAEKKAPSGYKWSLGGGLAVISNSGLGRGDEMLADIYSGSGNRLNLFANFIFNEAHRIGVQGYAGISTIPEDEASSGFGALSLIDLGVAAYKHFTIIPNIEVTPLLGLQVSGLQPDLGDGDSFLAFGARAEVSLSYALGRNKEHVLSLTPALNVYGGGSDSGDVPAEAFGLADGGSTIEFGLGYQYRFTTAFGTGRLFTLE